MKNLFLIVTAIIFLLSCNKQEIPEDILSKEKMVSILIDVHVAEAKIGSHQEIKQDSLPLYYKDLEESFLKAHHVNKETYKKSFKFYVEHADLFLEVYTAVVDSLTYRESAVKLD